MRTRKGLQRILIRGIMTRFKLDVHCNMRSVRQHGKEQLRNCCMPTYEHCLSDFSDPQTPVLSIVERDTCRKVKTGTKKEDYSVTHAHVPIDVGECRRQGAVLQS